MFTAAAVVVLSSLAAAIAAAPPAEAFNPSKSPVSPAGVRASCDLPTELHMRNTGGISRAGVPGKGSGLCVFTATEMMARSQCVPQLDGFQKWMTTKPGGGSPPKLAAMIAQFCREKGVREPLYVQHTGGDVRFLELAMKTRRVCGVTYAGSDDFYGGPIDHMVDLNHFDATSACIVDNNRPGWFVWMTRNEFITRWKACGGGWAVALIEPPIPPAENMQQWWNDRGKIPVQDADEHQYTNCPNGRCTTTLQTPIAVKAQPPAVAAPRVDRSGSAVQVVRDAGEGRTEYGSGTVIASERGRSLIVTNSHVVPDGSRPVAVFIGKKRYDARHLASTPLNPDEPDLALLTIDSTAAVSPIAAAAVPVGTVVYQWGFGGRAAGDTPTLKAGVTVDVGGYTGPKTLRTTIASQQGDSGSGLFDAAGNLVGVAWGGTNTHQFANKVEAVRSWVKSNAGEQFPALVGARKVEATAVTPNYGIDLDELDALTAGGRQRYWVRDRETHPSETFEAMAGGLVDDSDRYFLSVLGGDAERKLLDQVLTDPRVAKYRDRLHAKVFARESWVSKDRLRTAVTIQEPSPKGGVVIGTIDRVEFESIVALVLDVFEPKPPVVPSDPPVKPDVPSIPAESDYTWLVVLALAGVACWWVMKGR